MRFNLWRVFYALAWLWWLVMLVSVPADATGHTRSHGTDLLLGGLILVLLPLRKRYTTLLTIGFVLLSPFTLSGLPGVFWMIAQLTSRRHWPCILSVGFLAVLVASPAWALLVVDEAHASSLLVFLGASLARAVFFLAAFFAGLYGGAHHDLRVTRKEKIALEEERASILVKQAQAEERNRIAREMHDVLAHRISLISLYSSALTYRKDLAEGDIQEITEQIQQNSRLALDELRSVLGSLQDTSAQEDIAKPQPTLMQLPALFSEVRQAGQEVEARIAVEDIPATLSRHAYRIIQESLTNARKHAPNATVSVLVDEHNDGLRVLVSNAVTQDAHEPPPGTQQGLIGLRERVEAVKGVFTAGIVDKEFQVKAWMPW
ncbi:sensor histidine kinase [Corynebacterium cystitidis]|uniref:sensor histidine kinase n=1 Tax=Corynebacterium cystitidis TaxID=35757 RepID=UPI00211DB7E5|nr:histidine kinase [Corynebacterium cystitidis]